MADVVIIGGGPVGCWTAIQTKLRRPDLDVQIYERRAEYVRDHTLTIQRNSLVKNAARTKDKKERALYKDIASLNNDAADLQEHKKLKKVVTARTQSLEKLFKDYCAKLGINFTYEAMESPQQVMERHPECKIFIAADGAHSKMRTGLLGENSTVEKDLLHSVDVKYKAEGQAAFLREHTYNKVDLIVVETVGKEENGQTEVGLRFIVDKHTFDRVPNATAKQPLSFEQLHAATAYNGGFAFKVREFQHLRQNYTNEKRIEDSEVITKIRLSQYASKRFAVTAKPEGRDRAGWFFVGDAAMGMPFYRAVNVGLRMGSELAEIIASTENTPLLYKAAAYNARRPIKVFEEFTAASMKLASINLYKNAIRPTLRVVGVVGLVIVAVPLVAITCIITGGKCPRAM
ncbi:MAG: FAD-dependent oxidoreductase [Alphaproteobacteria bacterium]|nr:FAD-dependent oxidoreductase [Alphaproteobacteria bacterium]